jgi:hypothetical protein
MDNSERPHGLKWSRVVLMCATTILVTSCGSLNPPPLPPAKSHGTAYNEVMPAAKLNVLCATPALTVELLREADDPAIPFHGLRRVANGSLSIGFKDSRHRWMRGYECGGHCFVSGIVGEACTLEVVNETDYALDFSVSQDGSTFAAGTLHLDGHQRKSVPLHWTSVLGVDALHRFDLSGQHGAVCITTYPTPGPRKWVNERLTKLPTGGPQRKFAPLALPFEYR